MAYIVGALPLGWDESIFKIMKKISSEKETHFIIQLKWCLKPLTICTRFAAGVNLELSTKGSSGLVGSIWRISFLGFLILLSNLVFNGPRTIFQPILNMKSILSIRIESAWELVSTISGVLITFTYNTIQLILNSSVPVVHSAFILLTLTSCWHEIIEIFSVIHHKMKLDATFYRKCRKSCQFAVILLILVISYL